MMANCSMPMKITSPTLHATIIFTLFVFAIILMLSFVLKVEVVAKGQGRVLPISRVQVVQPEFSGSITAINVNNGDSVEQGDVLIEFDATEALTDLGTIQAEQDRLRIEVARIDAMVAALDKDSATPGFTDQALAGFSLPLELAEHAFAEEQRKLLLAEINDLLISLEQVDAREVENRRSEAVTNANIARVNAILKIQEERLHAAEQLLQRGGVSRFEFLDVQEGFTKLESERDVYQSELAQKSSERMAIESERRRITTELRSSLLDRRAKIDSRLATLFEKKLASERRVEAATLEAPVSGVVDQLKVFTLGGIAEAGAELLRIVPTDAQVEVEGTFSNQDVGFMEIGQRANIRLKAFPSERFGVVQGVVADIAADSSETKEGQWHYVVSIKPEQPFLDAGSERFYLRPGMTATVDAITDTRRIISYFFAPIVKAIQDSLGER
ncbi:HlyD family type I secretion periplasmic adaptor subunit [Litchfieldella qijiaojingensis]|uniref:Membrane fusion protein (MFP) family protein n=1 Tax=Litchfieldella qijiaojingensis TaxID=980347 RepID=A0ABQ2YWR8_9GAMM|nr:HlyD family type I secretion periplasmic adaptor subunit [Halomonas qijiaojingensis]GGX97917.1 HlyD family type I secretion periplasmic adaptor subunit [Halomonas qijiaojingensis]